MVRQKGFLDVNTGPEGAGDDAHRGPRPYPLATRGVLVRHLILPGKLRNSCEALTMLFLEFGADLPLSIMSQYTPVRPSSRHPSLNRRVTAEEFREVLEHAEALGFRSLFVQRPDESFRSPCGDEPFLPDFRRMRPFPGNVRRVPT